MATTIEDIKRVLWAGADTFRGVIDAANYKDYVLTMLFIKFLNDTFEEWVDELKAKYPDKPDRVARAIPRLPFQLKEDIRYTYLYDKRYDSDIGATINQALQGIEDLNGELRGIFRGIDFNAESVFGNQQQKTTKLRLLLEDFHELNLRPSQIVVPEGQTAAEVIGDAYEYMIGEFAARAGQKAGAFFTPPMVSELMGRLTTPQNDETIYDPTCGSASLLLRAAKQADLKKVGIYGQEINGSAYAMARMNLFIHDVPDAQIKWGDTLANPLHLDADGNLKQFDVIVANMPFSLDKWAEGFNPGGESDGEKDKKGKDKKFKMEASHDRFHRFEMGVPPASKGDWAFLLHMLASLKNFGRMAAVVPHGVLFRGASEGRIRQTVIDNNLLDAVIGLPENLFFGTSIKACILIFKKNRNTDNVLFIDASEKDAQGNLRYTKGKNQNLLEEKHIRAIFDAYTKREDVEKFAHVASLEEIRANDYNLNIPRYVDTFEAEELIDIDEVQGNIKRIKEELATVEAQMEKYLKEIGL